MGSIVDQLRETLLGSFSERDGEGLDPDGVRVAASRWEAALASDFNAHWHQAQKLPGGPIDVIDMFSGCGGMSAGFKAVNSILPAFQHVMAVEIDPVANQTYEANLGLKPLDADISELARDGEQLKKALANSARRDGHPLILIGCAPCQGFSSHRNGGGHADVRNSLFVDFAKIAATLEPDVVVVENVPEMLTARYWP